MITLEYGWIIAIAGIIASFIFAGACIYHHCVPRWFKWVESLGFGALIPVGMRMMYAAFNPAILCEIVDTNRKLVEDANLYLTFGEHTLEVVAGGFCVILASIYSLGELYKKPSH